MIASCELKFNLLHFYSYHNISFTLWKKIAKSENVFWRERRFQYFVLFYQFVSCRVSNEFLVRYSFFDTWKEAGTRDRQRHWQSISEIHFRLDLWEILVISYLFSYIFAYGNWFSSLSALNNARSYLLGALLNSYSNKTDEKRRQLLNIYSHLDF